MTKSTTKTVLNKLLICNVLKQIVTFYYNLFNYHSNLLKNHKNMPIDNKEHKSCLALLKAAVETNINFIY